ncbi:Uncharacterized protein RNJ44_03913 [Nakaseomyces bracarensis]|uniref:Globin domain-containing protein n=1 Tax=Nakaseomyces bracarensis TaxID=273131 RepID=A0ABR4NYQ0_9SACH
MTQEEVKALVPHNKMLENIMGETKSLVKLASAKKSVMSSTLNDFALQKVELVLNEREIELIRDSWFIMLNDDLSPETMTAFYGKLRQNKKLSLTSNLITNEKFSVLNEQYEEKRKHIINNTSIPYQVLNTSSIEGSLFCAQFYENLIAMDQNVERMFPSIRHQAVSFSGVLNTAVDNLENIHVLDSYLRGIGKRHARILGIIPAYFETMGKAFIRTFQDRFGVFFTIELEDIWSRLYSYLANGMIAFGVDPVIPQSLKTSRKNSIDTLNGGSSSDNSRRDSFISKNNESEISDFKRYMAEFNHEIVEEDDLDFPIPGIVTTETSFQESDIRDVENKMNNFTFNKKSPTASVKLAPSTSLESQRNDSNISTTKSDQNSDFSEYPRNSLSSSTDKFKLPSVDPKVRAPRSKSNILKTKGNSILKKNTLVSSAISEKPSSKKDCVIM